MFVRVATSGVGWNAVVPKFRCKHRSAKNDDQLRCEDQTDECADRRILQGTALQFRKINVQHHDDEEEKNRNRSDVDDQKYHRKELSAGQQEQSCGVEECKDQEQHGMHGIACRNHHERTGDGYEGE